MHARWWGSADLGHLDWLPRPNYVSGLEYEDPTARDPWAKFLDRTKGSLPQSLLALCKKLRHDRSVLDRLSTPPLTLVHGDLRLNNVMYSSAGNNATRTFIDWQTAVRGRGPMDIASLFTSSLQPDDRRIAEVELLPAYHASLLQRGVTDYSLEDCWQDYRLAVANQFSQVVFLSSVLDVEDRLEEGVGEATGLRLASALVDLDLERLLPGRRRWRGWMPRLPGLMARLWP
jgi:hypothetical protein